MADHLCKIPVLNLEIHIASPLQTSETNYAFTGHIHGDAALCEGGSLFVEVCTTGLVHEVFFDSEGRFHQELELAAEKDNPLELLVHGVAGSELGRTRLTVRHGTQTVDDTAAPPAVLEPPWPEFARLVKHCLLLAGDVAEKTGRNREELFEQVYAQERYAEKAWAEDNARVYHECVDNLKNFHVYLEKLQPRPQDSWTPTIDDVRQEVPVLRREFQLVMQLCRSHGRDDLHARLRQQEQQLDDLEDRAKKNLLAVINEINKLYADLDRIARAARAAQKSTGPGYATDA